MITLTPTTIFKSVSWLVLVMTLVACATGPLPTVTAGPAEGNPESNFNHPTPTPVLVVELPDLGPAPDIANDTWLNSDRPLNLAALRGKVVLLEFWTFG